MVSRLSLPDAFRRFRRVFVLLIVLLLSAVALPRTSSAQESSQSHATACRDWHECRQRALDALANGELERFHDYAWRTMQTGPAKDPDLMYLLARAQALSGRPHDALVMLGRLADMGVVTDAATSDEFRGVRALKDWPDLEARLRAISQPAREEAAAAAPPAAVLAPPPPAASARPADTPPPAPSAPAETTPRIAAPFRGEEAVRVTGVAFKPRGLAYDAVSSRFVIADPAAGKLVVLDERSHRAVDLVRASSAGFSDIAAFEIDGRRGDLWVVSTGGSIADGGSRVSLHKLQLVSGRQLASFAVPPVLAAGEFKDIAVTPSGNVLMLDGLASRIIAFDPVSHQFSVAASFDVAGATSVAPVDDRSAYVAHANGITHIDLSTKHASPLHANGRRQTPAVPLDGFERIRWAQGALVGIRRQADGTFAAVRLRIAAGGATTEQAVDVAAPIVDPTAVALSGSDLYLLTRAALGEEVVVERFRLK